MQLQRFVAAVAAGRPHLPLRFLGGREDVPGTTPNRLSRWANTGTGTKRTRKDDPMPPLSIADAELLADAHLDLLAAQSAGITVLGRTNHTDLIHTAHAMQAQTITADTVTALPQASHDLQEVAA